MSRPKNKIGDNIIKTMYTINNRMKQNKLSNMISKFKYLTILCITIHY